MASISLINKVKHSSLLYSAYYYIGSFFVNALRLILRPDNKLILFVCYGGKKYEDSPKDIYESMVKDKRFDSYKKVWAFINPEKYDVGGGRKIKIDTFKYYKTALRARVWITNVGVTRALSFKGLHTLAINSWHGTPIKYIGNDANKETTFFSKGSGEPIDVLLAQGDYEVERFAQAFHLPKENVVKTGLPRNDVLVRENTPDRIMQLKEKLGIPFDKKVILYAPTYRDYEMDNGSDCVMSPPLDLEKWRTILGKEYVFLLRAHFVVMKVLNVKENEFVRDFSSYPTLSDLLLITDILITDYSSILFDYSILGRPIFCYVYDYEKYKMMRGMYFDIRKEVSYAEEEEELIDEIQNINWKKEEEKIKLFRDRYVQQYGSASEKVLDIIYDNIKM